MKCNIGPGTDSVRRGVLPGLEGIFVVEVVSGLPVVEDFIAILDWAEDSSQNVSREEDVECKDGLHMELLLSRAAICQGATEAWRWSFTMGTHGVPEGSLVGLCGDLEPVLSRMLEHLLFDISRQIVSR